MIGSLLQPIIQLVTGLIGTITSLIGGLLG